MENNPSEVGVWQLLILLVMYVPIGIVSRKLAIEKGRNVTLWTFLGLLPLVNFWCFWFFVGAANFRLERKIDQLLGERE